MKESRIWGGVGTSEWAKWLGRDVAYWKGSYPVVKTVDGNRLLKVGDVVSRTADGGLIVTGPNTARYLG